MCFGLDSEERALSGFSYAYSIYQVEYSRNLLFRVGGQMDRLFNTMVDRTRSRLDVPTLRTLFGLNPDLSSRQEVVIETPRWDLTKFKLNFGLLNLKAYTKGEHVLRLETIVHNTRRLGCGRMIEKFPQIVARLAGMTERFCAVLDCVDVGFIPDDLLDELPQPSWIGATRVGGIDLNKPCTRAVLAAVLALAAAPVGFTLADVAGKVNAMTGHVDYTVRQAAYDLRKLRGKSLVKKPGRSRRYAVPPAGARTISALLTLGDQVIVPLLAGVRSPRLGRKPSIWTPADRHYERLRVACRPCSTNWGSQPLHRQFFADRRSASP